MACRRLSQASELDTKRVLENVRMGQMEVGFAAAMLEVLTEVSRGADQPEESFGLASAVTRGVAQLALDHSKGTAVTTPGPSTRATTWGSPKQVEQAISDLTFHAVKASEPNGVVRWELETEGPLATLTCRWKGGLGGSRGDHMFTISRDPLGDTRGLGLLLARWAFESHGGELVAEEEGTGACFVARIPIEEKEESQ